MVSIQRLVMVELPHFQQEDENQGNDSTRHVIRKGLERRRQEDLQSEQHAEQRAVPSDQGRDRAPSGRGPKAELVLIYCCALPWDICIF